MTSFLENIAHYVLSKHEKEIDRVTLVFPNKRASLFFKRHFSSICKSTVWAPTIYSIEEFVENLTDLTVVDNLHLLLNFYEVYKAQEKEQAHSLDEFVQWAQVVLHDFNEIDLHLVDASNLFDYLNEDRAMEVWNPDRTELTGFQKDYLRFWKNLGSYYTLLKTELNKKNQAYQGMAYREAVEKVNRISDTFSDNVIFAGFNALTNSEKTIISTLVKSGKAEIVWDSDVYYTQNKTHEAGHFLRKHKENPLFLHDKLFLWEKDYYATIPKEINVYGVAGNVNMTKFAGNLLQQISSEKQIENTALVLANENLLVPTLQSIPDTIGSVNVTMGYPITNSSFFDFCELCLRLQENAIEKRNAFYYKDIIRILSHPFILFDEDISSSFRKYIYYIRSKNRIYLSSNEILSYLEKENCPSKEAFSILFTLWQNEPLQAISCFLSLIESSLVSQRGMENCMKLHKRIDNEFLYEFTRELKKLKLLIQEHKSITTIKTFRLFFSQALKSKTIPFYGEPLYGLQVMGMLETRTLDFDTVILLSANEDLLPVGKSYNSFIPFEVKKAFGMPTYFEKDAIFSYHFYRLMQRAKRIFILYNMESKGFGTPEKSRFITQLVHELPKYNPDTLVYEKLVTSPIHSSVSSSTVIEKNDAIITSLKTYFKKGTSASALINYLQCPLDFYYKYVLRFREADEVEEIIESSTLGSFIHRTLELLYKPFEGRVIGSHHIKEMLGVYEEVVLQVFYQDYSPDDLKTGKNFLTLTLAKKQIASFFKNELIFLKEIESKGQVLTFLSSELIVERQLDVNGIPVILKGQIDRVDLVGKDLRVIDYKTGKVETRELKIPHISDIFDGSSKGKSIQLFTYLYLVSSVLDMDGLTKSAGIISFKKLKQGIMQLSVDDQTEIGEKHLMEFEEGLKNLVLTILDSDVPFEHNPESKYCAFCS